MMNEEASLDFTTHATCCLRCLQTPLPVFLFLSHFIFPSFYPYHFNIFPVSTFLKCIYFLFFLITHISQTKLFFLCLSPATTLLSIHQSFLHFFLLSLLLSFSLYSSHTYSTSVCFLTTCPFLSLSPSHPPSICPAILR